MTPCLNFIRQHHRLVILLFIADPWGSVSTQASHLVGVLM